MTRSVQTPRVAYSGSGTSGPFTVTFTYLSNDHVLVYLIDSDDVSALLTEGTNYTLSSNVVTTTDTVDVGETLVIYRATPVEQDADFPANGSFSSVVSEAAFDKVVDQVADLKARVDFFGLPLSGKAPTDAVNAGKYIKLNTTGTALETAEGVDVSALTPGINCLVVATSNITLSGTQTIDGVSVAVGNTVLVQGQTDKSENGVYTVAAGAWTRHTDHDSTAELQANTSFGVTSGTDYSGSIWVQLVLDPTVGTDDIVFGRLGGSIGLSDILVAANGTINFGTGDMIAQHSSNLLAWTGGQMSIIYNGAATSEPLRLVNSTDNASVQVAQLEGDRATPANNDEAYVSLLVSDSGGTQTEIGRVTWKATTVTDTSEAGRLQFGVMTAGSLADELYLTGAAFTPAANGGLTLGSTALGWDGLHLKTGSALNWANGEIIILESANALAMTGGSLSVTDGTAATTAAITAKNTTDNATVKGLTIAGDRATMANNDAVYAEFQLSDSAGNQDEFARITVTATDVANGSEDAEMKFSLIEAGVLTDELKLTLSALAPTTSGGLTQGTSALPWGGAFYSSGAAVTFNNAIAITHSAGFLTGTGGQFVWSYGGGATSEPLRLINTTDNASVQVAQFEGDRATMADADEAYISFLLSDDGGTQTELARQTWVAVDVNTGTSVDGQIDWGVMTAGVLADELSLDGTALFPSTNDGLSIGKSGKAISDLYAASGAVFDWNAGEMTLTHSADTLSFSGAYISTDRTGTADNNYHLGLRASNIVAHGVTGTLPTDMYGAFNVDGAGGGLNIKGVVEDATITAIRFTGVGDTNTTKSTAGTGVFSFDAYENDGTSNAASPTANSNMAVFRAGTTTRFILDADGESHMDVGTSWLNYDFVDDIKTLNSLAYHVSSDSDPIKQKFNEWTLAKRESLEAIKLVNFGEDGRPFMNMSKLAMLHTGAIRQLGEQLAEREARIVALEQRLLAIESK